jgi:hypothetical protein
MNQAISVPLTRPFQNRVFCRSSTIVPRHKQFDATISLLQDYRDYSSSFSDHQELTPVHIPLQSVKETDREILLFTITEKSVP